MKTTDTTAACSGTYASLALRACIILVSVVSLLEVFYLYFFFILTLFSSSHRVRLIFCPEDHHHCSFYLKSYSSSWNKVPTKGLGYKCPLERRSWCIRLYNFLPLYLFQLQKDMNLTACKQFQF